MKTNFKKFLGIILIVVACMSFLVACKESESEIKNKQAYELIESKEYKAAYDLFLELGDYKDSVKEVSRFHYANTNTKVEIYFGCKEEVETYTTTYNEKNLPLNRVEVYSDGSIYTYNYSFDEQGQLVSSNYSEEHGDISRTEYTYNEKGELIKYYYKDSYMEDIVEYTYDENGNHKTAKHSDGNGVIYDVEYFYNEFNYLVQEKYVTKTDLGLEIATYDYEYDIFGNLIKKVYTNKGKINSVTIYTYDKKDNCIEEVYTTDYINKVTNYTYDENNYCIKKVVTTSDSIRYEYTMTYDENGNLIKEIEIDPFGYQYHYEYSYEFVYVPYDIDNVEWENLMYYQLGFYFN